MVRWNWDRGPRTTHGPSKEDEEAQKENEPKNQQNEFRVNNI